MTITTRSKPKVAKKEVEKSIDLIWIAPPDLSKEEVESVRRVFEGIRKQLDSVVGN